ncbi:MAG: secretin N-terminal domain-containing protein [Fuerstiella sp.]
MTDFQRRFQSLLVLIVILGSACSSAMAQRGGGSESDLLRRQEVRAELGLSETQITKLEEAQKNSSPGREFFEPFLQRIKDAPDKEAEAAVRAEMTAAVANAGLEFKKATINVLNDSQKKKLRGVFLRSAGPRGLTDATVAADYGITQEQIAKINELSDLRRNAARDLPSGASEEDRDKFNADWQSKFMAELTPEQKARFEKESAEGEQPATTAVAANGQPAVGIVGSVMVPGQVVPAGEVVSTFGGGTVAGERKRVEEFSFNFRGAPWEQVLQMYADGAGLTLDLNQIPPGTFSHYDDNKYTPRQTLDILNGYLLRKGYAMMENNGFLIVLNVDNGIPPYLVPSATIEELVQINSDGFEVGEHQLVSVTMPIEGMDTARAAQEVEAIVGPHGSLIALTESSILIVTDTGGSLRRIHALLTAAMSKSKPDALLFKAYYLKNMDAEEAELQVKTQFGMRQGATNVSSAVEMQSRMQSRTQAQQPPQRGGAPTPAAKTEPTIQIASDLRLNGLLVTGTAAQHKLVEEILASLDVSEGPNGESLTRGRKGVYLEVYTVKTADAGEVTKTLTAMNIAGVTVVNEERSTGKIHIMASERQHEEVAVIIRQLDGSGSSGMVAVIQLAQMDPLSAAATLRSLFYADGTDAPTIETDLYGRRLIVRGDMDQITQIKQVLADLGEDGTGVRARGDGGTVRQFSLQGRNPEDFVKILKQAWDANETQKINIIIPNEPGPIRSRRTTGEVETGVDRRQPQTSSEPGDDVSQTSRGSKNASGDHWKQWRKPTNQLTAVASAYQQDEQSAAAEQTESDSNDSSGKKGVDVIVYGDQLILSSPDEAELDRLEDLMDQLQQSMPFKPEYTVVYLKSADALEAADMLSQFFPSSSVASSSSSSGGSMLGSLGSSMSSMGSSLMDMTGLSGLGASSNSLKIIPDPRTNSLFMTGPQMMIKDALTFLDVLDSNDIPESLKDMQPHFIQVEYADVRDVESHLKEVFKVYTESQGGGRQQQQNPFAAMLGGGGGRGGDDAAQQVRMMIAADTQTSTLTVNCNQSLFEEVELVVRQLDESTRIANPGIRVIQLKNADASMIQQSISALIPRVSVSSSRTGGSGTSGSNTSGSSGGDSSGGSSSNPQQDAFNRMMQMRGGGGTTPGGGRTGFGGGTTPGGGRTGFGGGTTPGGGRTGFGGGASPFGGGGGTRGGGTRGGR